MSQLVLFPSPAGGVLRTANDQALPPLRGRREPGDLPVGRLEGSPDQREGVSSRAQHRPYRVPIYRVALIREATLLWPRPQFRNSEDVAGFVRQAIGDTDREHFVVIMLDRKHRLIGANTVSIGSATASVVHPREVFKPALAPTPEQALWQQTVVHNAVAVLFGHNHPSGDPAPSQEDRALTQRLVDCGKLLGIQVLDHVIVGDGTSAYLSFADQSLL